jgi:hypothetical protein
VESSGFQLLALQFPASDLKSIGWQEPLNFSEKVKSDSYNKTHRPSAWGVLGSTTDGLPFLLTHPVVFRSIYTV